MSDLDKYLEWLQKSIDDQYGDGKDNTKYNLDDMEWIPAESPAKEKLDQYKSNSIGGMIDLTTVKSDKIKEEILKGTNLRVGNFKIRVSRYKGMPSKDGFKLALNLTVWEERNKTSSGNPCKIDCALNFEKDNRFNNQPWLKYFIARGNIADNVPIDIVVDIVRWMIVVKKLSAFL